MRGKTVSKNIQTHQTLKHTKKKAAVEWVQILLTEKLVKIREI